ncbi:MAG: hypothetical protein SA339_11975 [Methanomassiliicoccus sp.]|nr:hypothetical protein [Methanomassiliicoccus sp.]
MKPRTEAEEDQIALELFILEHEGEESLREYQANPTRRALKFCELPQHQREIIERARLNQRDFSKPAQEVKDGCRGRCSI